LEATTRKDESTTIMPGRAGAEDTRFPLFK